jgi:hypothetical protein
LSYELDGQLAAQPPHWREKSGWLGPQIWLTGQAVALRETSWQLERSPTPELEQRWSALVWMLGKLNEGMPSLPQLGSVNGANKYAEQRAAADRYAKEVAGFAWTGALAKDALVTLAQSGDDLTEENRDRAKRAEILMVSMDRLLPSAAIPEEKRKTLDSSLNELFATVQSLNDSGHKGFKTLLDRFSETLMEKD